MSGLVMLYNVLTHADDILLSRSNQQHLKFTGFSLFPSSEFYTLTYHTSFWQLYLLPLSGNSSLGATLTVVLLTTAQQAVNTTRTYHLTVVTVVSMLAYSRPLKILEICIQLDSFCLVQHSLSF